jgi:hypothetical protein
MLHALYLIDLHLVVKINHSEHSEDSAASCGKTFNFFLALPPSKVKFLAKWESQNMIASYDNHIAINGRSGTCPVNSKYIEAYVLFSNIAYLAYLQGRRTSQASNQQMCLLLGGCLVGLRVDPEDRRSKFLQK